MRTAAVTGASGFVGRHLVNELSRRAIAVRALVREHGTSTQWPAGVTTHATGDLAASDSLNEALAGIDCVFHLAARAHVLSDAGGKNADAYRLSNEVATANLASAAAAAGVSRFILVSTIKVYGEADRGRPFTLEDEPRPEDPYGKSKLSAEQHLWQACRTGRMGGVVVRPPLIYGPGVRANFLRLMRWVERGIPLPFAAIHNRRSMVSVSNLTDLLCRCAGSDAARGHTFLVSDGRDLSTPDLVRCIAAAMGRRPRLLSVPVGALQALGRVTGYGGEVARLTDSLSLDITASQRRLSWAPPVSVEEGIDMTVAAYREYSS